MSVGDPLLRSKVLFNPYYDEELVSDLDMQPLSTHPEFNEILDQVMDRYESIHGPIDENSRYLIDIGSQLIFYCQSSSKVNIFLLFMSGGMGSGKTTLLQNYFKLFNENIDIDLLPVIISPDHLRSIYKNRFYIPIEHVYSRKVISDSFFILVAIALSLKMFTVLDVNSTQSGIDLFVEKLRNLDINFPYSSVFISVDSKIRHDRVAQRSQP